MSDCEYSVIMATSGEAPFIRGALDSIRRQSLAPSRVIIVANGSRNLDTMRLVSRAFPYVTLLESERVGQAHAYIRGLSLVETEFVSFLDHDDLWVPVKQERQTSLLARSAATEAVVGAVQNFVAGAEPRVTSSAAIGRVFGAVTFRTAVFTRVGPPDPEAGHFQWLFRWWAEAAKRSVHVIRHDDVVLERRVHGRCSWVKHGHDGRAQLLREIRRIALSRA